MELTLGDLVAAEAALEEQDPLLKLTSAVELLVDHLAVRAALLDRRADHAAARATLRDAIDQARAHGLDDRAVALEGVLEADDLALITPSGSAQRTKGKEGS